MFNTARVTTTHKDATRNNRGSSQTTKEALKGGAHAKIPHQNAPGTHKKPHTQQSTQAGGRDSHTSDNVHVRKQPDAARPCGARPTHTTSWRFKNASTSGQKESNVSPAPRAHTHNPKWPRPPLSSHPTSAQPSETGNAPGRAPCPELAQPGQPL